MAVAFTPHCVVASRRATFAPVLHAANSGASPFTRCCFRAPGGSLAVRPSAVRRGVARRRAGLILAQAQTVSEESPEPAVAEGEVEEGDEDVAEDGANGGATVSGILATVKEAFANGSEAAVAEAEAMLKALEADRDGLAQRAAALEQEAASGKERFLRLNADFDNFRKRSEREKGALATSVKGDVVEALLPMVDSFERAKSAIKIESEAEQKIDSAYQGIYKQFVEVMKSLGVAAVETVGKEFDPQVHEAIMREESVDFHDGVVVQEFRKGFVIGDKLLRPAMVKVSSGPGPAVVDPTEGSEPSSVEEDDKEASG